MVPFAIGMPGLPEMLVVLVVVLILFGAGKLPQVFESFGKAIKSFRDAQKDDAVDVTPGKLEDQASRSVPDIEEVGDRQVSNTH